MKKLINYFQIINNQNKKSLNKMPLKMLTISFLIKSFVLQILINMKELKLPSINTSNKRIPKKSMLTFIIFLEYLICARKRRRKKPWMLSRRLYSKISFMFKRIFQSLSCTRSIRNMLVQKLNQQMLFRYLELKWMILRMNFLNSNFARMTFKELKQALKVKQLSGQIIPFLIMDQLQS